MRINHSTFSWLNQFYLSSNFIVISTYSIISMIAYLSINRTKHLTLTRLTAYWWPSRLKTGAVVFRRSQPLNCDKTNVTNLIKKWSNDKAGILLFTKHFRHTKIHNSITLSSRHKLLHKVSLAQHRMNLSQRSPKLTKSIDYQLLWLISTWSLCQLIHWLLDSTNWGKHLLENALGDKKFW